LARIIIRHYARLVIGGLRALASVLTWSKEGPDDDPYTYNAAEFR